MAKGKQVENEFKAKVASGFGKVKADIQAIGTGISEEVKREKMERINRRISRHNKTLNELNTQLNELEE